MDCLLVVGGDTSAANITTAENSPQFGLHPNLSMVYQEKVAALADALASDDNAAALEIARGLIDRVAVHPTGTGDGAEIELCGALASMVKLGAGTGDHAEGGVDRGLFESSVNVVAGIGFEPMTFRL